MSNTYNNITPGYAWINGVYVYTKVPVHAPTWHPAPMYVAPGPMGAPPMPYYGYNGNFGHGHGHISSNGYNNVVPPYHNLHGPVESPSMAGPVGGMMGGTGSSANTFAQTRHDHNSQDAAERPRRGIRVHLPPGPDGRITNFFVRRRRRHHVPVGSPSAASPVGGPMGADGSSADTFAQHHQDLAESPRLPYTVRLPPREKGSSASIPVQQHVPAESHSMVSPAETPRRRNGSTLSPVAQPYQPQHGSGASYKSLPARETVRSDRAPPAQLGGDGPSSEAEIRCRFPLHGTRAPPTKRERRKLANKIKAEAEAARVAMAMPEAEAVRTDMALSEAGGDHVASSPVPEEGGKEDVEEKASNAGCGVASWSPDSQWLAVCRSPVYQAAGRRNAVVEQCEDPNCTVAICAKMGIQAAARRNAVVEKSEPGDVYVCEDPHCTVAICAKMRMPRVDSFELKDKADRVSPPPPHPIEAKRSVASHSRARAAARRLFSAAIRSLTPVRE